MRLFFSLGALMRNFFDLTRKHNNTSPNFGINLIFVGNDESRKKLAVDCFGKIGEH